MLLGACATRPPAPAEPDPPLAKVEDRVVIDGEVLPLPNDPAIRTESLPPQGQSSPVVRKLVDKAGEQQRNGDLEGAASSLERALRIEPRNARLWNQLADLRFAQKNWQQSTQLAAKSNTLAGADTNLRRRNWYLMANGYEAMGKPDMAQKYRQKLAQ